MKRGALGKTPESTLPVTVRLCLEAQVGSPGRSGKPLTSSLPRAGLQRVRCLFPGPSDSVGGRSQPDRPGPLVTQGTAGEVPG